MTKHDVTIEIDDEKLASYTDQRLALFWHVAQANPAEHGDSMAGELAERIGREISAAGCGASSRNCGATRAGTTTGRR